MGTSAGDSVLSIKAQLDINSLFTHATVKRRDVDHVTKLSVDLITGATLQTMCVPLSFIMSK